MVNALTVYATAPLAAPTWKNRAPVQTIDVGSQDANPRTTYAELIEVTERAAVPAIAPAFAAHLLPAPAPPTTLTQATNAYQTAANRPNRQRPGKNWDSWA